MRFMSRLADGIENLQFGMVNPTRKVIDPLFFEPEHTIKVFTLVIVLFAGLRIMRIRMMAVEEFDDMKPAFVDIEMDISRF